MTASVSELSAIDPSFVIVFLAASQLLSLDFCISKRFHCGANIFVPA